jgi:hypothetical protein
MDLQVKRLHWFGHGESNGQNTNTEKGKKRQFKGRRYMKDPQRASLARQR